MGVSLPHTRHTLRVFGVLSGASVIAVCLAFFITRSWTTISSFITRMWNIVFGLLMMACELDMECSKSMLASMSFLTTDLGRGIFFSYVGTMVLDNEWWEILIGCIAIGVGVFHILFAMMCEGAADGKGQQDGVPAAAKPTSGTAGDNPFSAGGGGDQSYSQPYGSRGSGGGAGDNPFQGNAHISGGNNRV